MKKSDFTEKVPLSIMTGAYGRYAAIIINTTGKSSVTDALSKLYPQSGYKIGITDASKEELNEAIAICSATGASIIVLGDDTLPDFRRVTPAVGFSTCLISSGSYNGMPGNILERLLFETSVKEFTHIAYQQYKYDPAILNSLAERYFETLRLGLVRENIESAEPLIRDREYIFFDMNSIRYSDFPDNLEQSPNGLYAEEACTLARYIGMNQKMRVCYIFGFKPDTTPGSPSSQLAAEIIWHMAEGISASVNEDPSEGRDEYFQRKIISMGDEGQDLVFVTSSLSGRWWMEIPEFKDNRTRYVACSLSDYLCARNGEVPLRWILYFQKINPK